MYLLIIKMMEKSIYKVSALADGPKCFSQFPPSIYRRSLAATKIQRGPYILMQRFEYTEDAKCGLLYSKGTLKLPLKSSECAEGSWGKLKSSKIHQPEKYKSFGGEKCLYGLPCYVTDSKTGCIYHEPISVLHRQATIIQRKWRLWKAFKNSPLALKYNCKVEDLEKAATKIAVWWRPLKGMAAEKRQARTRLKAQVCIAAFFRGYILRKHLKQDVRVKLLSVGKKMIKHRSELIKIKAIYTVQRFWRSILLRRAKEEKYKTRYLAATRIQSLWRGFWIRSRNFNLFRSGASIQLR
jgi:hypothetical protein